VEEKNISPGGVDLAGAHWITSVAALVLASSSRPVQSKYAKEVTLFRYCPYNTALFLNRSKVRAIPHKAVPVICALRARLKMWSMLAQKIVL